MEWRFGQRDLAEVRNVDSLHDATALELRMVDCLFDGQHRSRNEAGVAEELDCLVAMLEPLVDPFLNDFGQDVTIVGSFTQRQEPWVIREFRFSDSLR